MLTRGLGRGGPFPVLSPPVTPKRRQTFSFSKEYDTTMHDMLDDDEEEEAMTIEEEKKGTKRKKVESPKSDDRA